MENGLGSTIEWSPAAASKAKLAEAEVELMDAQAAVEDTEADIQKRVSEAADKIKARNRKRIAKVRGNRDAARERFHSLLSEQFSRPVRVINTTFTDLVDSGATIYIEDAEITLTPSVGVGESPYVIYEQSHQFRYGQYLKNVNWEPTPIDS